MRRVRHRLLLVLLAAPALLPASAAGDPVREALLAEASLDTRRALELFLSALPQRPDDAFLHQKIARQYSDLVVDLPTPAEKRRSAEQALEHAQRAATLDPHNAENALSVAVSLGKLAVFSGVRDKVRYSRELREAADRALALDPNYAWAHHVLGRWHHEVAELGTTARWIVTLFYGGLPDASREEAVRHLERAVELEPGQLKHHLELGFALLAAHQPDRARAAFQAGLAMPSREKHDEPAKARARAALARLDHEAAPR